MKFSHRDYPDSILVQKNSGRRVILECGLTREWQQTSYIPVLLSVGRVGGTVFVFFFDAMNEVYCASHHLFSTRESCLSRRR
jgi:hypothetical protein